MSAVIIVSNNQKKEGREGEREGREGGGEGGGRREEGGGRREEGGGRREEGERGEGEGRGEREEGEGRGERGRRGGHTSFAKQLDALYYWPELRHEAGCNLTHHFQCLRVLS